MSIAQSIVLYALLTYVGGAAFLLLLGVGLLGVAATCRTASWVDKRGQS